MPPGRRPANWAGFYIGGNLGGSWGDADTDTTLNQINFGIGDIFPGTVIHQNLHPDGFIGGGQFGYNLQSNVWLFGFETDFQGTTEEDSSGQLLGVLGPCTLGVCNFLVTSNITARLNWFGTVRGRVGFIWDGWLIYATGGFAYGEIDLSGRNTVAFNALGFNANRRFNLSTVATGGAVGGGIEHTTWWNNVTWRVEYLYLDFGSVSERFNGGRVSTDFTDNIVRFGLNIKLSPPPP